MKSSLNFSMFSRMINVEFKLSIKVLNNTTISPEEVDWYFVSYKTCNLLKKLAIRGSNDPSMQDCETDQFRVFVGPYNFWCEKLEC